jgi:hypothetical protein
LTGEKPGEHTFKDLFDESHLSQYVFQYVDHCER